MWHAKAPVSLKTIAARVGYSKNTVSLALRNDRQIPPATRNRIRAVATELGYRNNALVSELMSQLGARRPAMLQAKFALLAVGDDWREVEDDPALGALIEGCFERAELLGYSFDRFWLGDRQFTPERWVQILRARGIVGGLMLGLRAPGLPGAAAARIAAEIPCVYAGLPLVQWHVPFACVDHHEIVVAAVEQARRVGRRRPGMIIARSRDRLAGLRYTAGMSAAQEALAPADRVPALVLADETAPAPAIREWVDRCRPDFILHADPAHLDGVLGCDSVNLAEDEARSRDVGGAAVDLLLEQIRSRRESKVWARNILLTSS